MPTYRIGDMWSEYNEVDYFIITTNSTVKNNDALMMGSGFAKQVRNKWPNIDVRMGKAILDICQDHGFYGLILGKHIGLFQVKYYFIGDADLELIKGSTAMLYEVAVNNPNTIYALNYPGIGDGKLSIDQVKPVINDLPMNVHVWRSSDD